MKYNELAFTYKKQLPILIFFITLFYATIQILYFPQVEENVEMSSVLSEGLIAIIILFSIFLLKVEDKKIYSLMLIGLTLILVAMTTDTLDEVYGQPRVISLFLEDVALIVGFIFINLGIYSWSKYSNKINSKLEERVANEVEKNKQKERIIFNQSKLSSMGEMIGAIAHQWRQPLNALALNIQIIEEDYDDGLVNNKYLKNFEKENMKFIRYMSKTIDDFRNFAKDNKDAKEINITDSIINSYSLFKTQLDDKQISFNLKGDDCLVSINENEFRQVMLNIINNAKDELLQKDITNPKIEVTVTNFNNQCIINIEDNAKGIPEDILPRLFEPYFTTKSEGEGTGLGLYMSKKIIEESMKGQLSAKNGTTGAIFSIHLKLSNENTQ